MWSSPARQRSPADESTDCSHQRSPARQRAPVLQRSPARQHSHVRTARQQSPERRQSPAPQRTTACPVPDARHAHQRSPTRPRPSDLGAGKVIDPLPRQRSPTRRPPPAHHRAFSPVRTSKVHVRPRAHESTPEPAHEHSPLSTSAPPGPAPQLATSLRAILCASVFLRARAILRLCANAHPRV
ncbi:serine/arginine repetitive matrix protein 1-like [Palaemon carinicauda]|uniref:serine/arginine repetitive matrix protein 1-like n=1 Tax=Palaemon carinicauda TaxID=392227 RepID=UPI0035B5DC76